VATEMTTLKEMDPEKRAVVDTFPVMSPEDIADGVIYVLSTPEHVQVKINLTVFDFHFFFFF
jgi:NADP+-dependent farnesol dehydrogenase